MKEVNGWLLITISSDIFTYLILLQNITKDIGTKGMKRLSFIY